MNDPRDKPPHSKHANVKSKTRETQYLKYRSFKPKCVESRVADYINSKKSRVDAGTAAISASTRFQHHQHPPNQHVKASRSNATKTATGSSHHQVEVHSIASDSKKPVAKRPAKNHRLLHANHQNGKQLDGEEKDGHKTETNIQTDARKAAKSKQRHHPHKKYKTFDIASFPRVFSTSDLMEKMNEEPVSNDPREKCEFHNVDLQAAPTAQPLPPHAEDEQQLEFRNEDVNIDITCHQSQLVDTPAFPQVDAMVFKCEPLVLPTPNSANQEHAPRFSGLMKTAEGPLKPPSTPKEGGKITPPSPNISEPPMNGEQAPGANVVVLNDEPDGRLLAQTLARENETLKVDLSKQQNVIQELHKCLHEVRDKLRLKGDLEEEMRRLKDRFHRAQSELEIVVDQNAKLKEELEQNAALIDLLSKSNDLARVEGGDEPQTTSLDVETVAKLRSECDELRKTNAELLNDLRKYQTTIDRFQTKVDQQEKALRMLEDVKVASANQLGVYETEMAFLRNARAKMVLENEQLEARNKRLLNVLALNHVLALSKQHPYTCRSIAPNFDASLNSSRRRDRLQEIKHFNTSCQKFTATQ